jgi:hypothetical protein
MKIQDRLPIGGVCLLLPLILSSAHAALFKDSFENRSFAGFNFVGNPARIANSPVRLGNYSSAMSVASGSSARSELLVLNPKEFLIGREYWIGFGNLLTRPGDIVFNLHKRPDPGETAGTQPLTFTTGGGVWRLFVRHDANARSTTRSITAHQFTFGEIKGGQWTDWVFHLKLSYRADGLLEVWKNGVKVLNYLGPTCFNDNQGPFMKFGIYNPSGGPTLAGRTINYDEVKVGDQASSYAQVAPDPGTTPTPQPGTLQFTNTSYNVSEDGTAATITASRIGGTTGVVSVAYTTRTGGTATEGADYTFTSGVLSWADGDATTKSFNVPINNDVEVEGNETISLALGNPAGGATLGTPSTAALTITDDDQPPGASCGGQAATIVGTAASEMITGTVGADVIYGGAGNDLITALEGDDISCGGDGNDTLQSSFGIDQAFGEAGDDIVRGGDGLDKVDGGDGTDQVFGDQLDDALVGGTGIDRCDGGTGTDTAAACETVVNIP